MRPMIVFAVATLVLAGLSGAGFSQPPASSEPELTLGLVDPSQTMQVVIEGRLETISYVVTLDGDAVFQGDMLLGRAEDIQSGDVEAKLFSVDDPELFGLFRRGNYLWTKGIVPYAIADDVAHPDRIAAAIAHWQAKTGIEFVPATAQTPNSVLFVVGKNDDICLSSVGMLGGTQKIKIGANCATGNIVHEIGHALGLAHEQMRSDRDDFIRVHLDKVAAGYEGNFGKNPGMLKDFGDYCYDSIMHYPATAFSIDGSPTIEPLKDVKIGQRSTLAPCDIDVIQDRYAAEIAAR